MLTRLFSMYSGSIGETIVMVLISIVVALIAITVHEFAHGFVAYKLGDSTAKADGRLSLNPLHHLDPIGTIMLLVVGFGYAKPVPVMTRNFKKPRRDFALVSLAGPLSNFVLAFISALIYELLVKYLPFEFASSGLGFALLKLFFYGVSMNVGLGLFNLIPIPPLDGSNILMCLLPNHLAAKYAGWRRYAPYIMIAIVVMTWLPYPISLITEIIFWPLNVLDMFIINGFIGFWSFIFGV